MMAGGITCINSSPTLKNLIISNNYARNVAGGIGLVNSNSLLENIIIKNNTIIDGDALGGGGVALNGGNAVIRNSTISNNYVGLNFYQVNGGGGILCGFTFDGSMFMNIDNVIIETKDKSIDNIGTDYDYLIKMPIYSLSQDKIDELQKELEKHTNEYNILENKSVKEIWLSELEELKVGLDRFYSNKLM